MRIFEDDLTATVNIKGVIDVDTVKGCTLGMRAHPDGGCYGVCYAANTARRYGYDFTKSVSRYPRLKDKKELFNTIINHNATWFRIGTMGDPSHDWPLTASVCNWFCRYKTPVVVTKHWIVIPDKELKRMVKAGVTVNTSISALDTKKEIEHRLKQHGRMKSAGINAVLRIVSAKFGDTENGRQWNAMQEMLFSGGDKVIDNPLRIPASDPRVTAGDIIVMKVMDLNSEISCSVANPDAYLGKCSDCPDQCGVLWKGTYAN